MRLSVDNNKNYDIVMRMIKWLFNLLHSIDFNRGGFLPCSHQLPTLRSVSIVPMRIKLRIYQRAFLFTAHVVKLKGKGIFIVNIFAFVSLLKARFLRQFLQKTQNVSVFTSVFVHQAVPGVRMVKPVTRSTDFVT